MYSPPDRTSLIELPDISHRRQLWSAIQALLVMAAVYLVARFLPLPEFIRQPLASMGASAAMHTLLETLAIVMASMIFAIGWSNHQRRSSRSLLVMACLFCGVAMLDFSHMLSYKGMPVYVTPSGVDKAILFWLAARALAALALLWVAIAPWQTERAGAGRFAVLMGVLPVSYTHLTLPTNREV